MRRPRTVPHGADHDHDIDIETALEFIDTAALERGVVVDQLASASDAAAWFRDHHLVHEADLIDESSRSDRAPSDVALARVRLVREALREIVTSAVEHRQAGPSAIDAVNSALGARDRPIVVASGDGLTLGHQHAAGPLDEAMARIAERIVRVAAGPDAGRLRICASDTCRWLFYDGSPTRRRRWCDMASCGNRAKAARHRARARAGGLDPEAVPA